MRKKSFSVVTHHEKVARGFHHVPAVHLVHAVRCRTSQKRSAEEAEVLVDTDFGENEGETRLFIIKKTAHLAYADTPSPAFRHRWGQKHPEWSTAAT